MEQEKGQFRSTLRLSERARAAVLSKKDYEGEVHRTKREAETSAARVFWDDPCVQERAKTLEPSKSARDIWEESRKQCKKTVQETKHSDRDRFPKARSKMPSASDVALKRVSTARRDSSLQRKKSSESRESVTPDQVGTRESRKISPRKGRRPDRRNRPKTNHERHKHREARTSSRSRSPRAKRQAFLDSENQRIRCISDVLLFSDFGDLENSFATCLAHFILSPLRVNFPCFAFYAKLLATEIRSFSFVF